ncbi:hypothetical protein tpqmel_0944, partial [Candidatus Gastranaerophilus sp. (ex Termes propinquus)]
TEEILSKGVQEGCAYQAARAVCKELGG